MQYIPHKKYIEADEAWLDKYPDTWITRKLKFSVRLINNKIEATNSELEYMGLEHIESWTGKRLYGGQSESDGVGNVFAFGDILFGKLRPYLAKVYKAEEEGLATSEVLVLRPEEITNPDFLKYYLLTPSFIDVVDGSTYGAKMPRASWDFIGELPVLLPRLEEQQKIAAFLDYKTQQIDQLIEKKKALIEKLEEKRIAVITQAVTKGLDKNAKLKPSGVDWLGDVPEHWNVVPIKFSLEIPITDGPHETPELFNDGIPFLSAEAVKNDKLDFSRKRGFISVEEHQRFSKKYKPKIGDVYMVKSGATTGNVARVETDEEFNIWSPLAALRPELTRSITDFLFFYMKSKPFFYSVELSWSYGTQQNIGMGVIANLKIALPSVGEQVDIAELITEQCVGIDKMVSKIDDAIRKLEEYRSAIITSGVTGKIDVREVKIPRVVT